MFIEIADAYTERNKIINTALITYVERTSEFQCVVVTRIKSVSGDYFEDYIVEHTYEEMLQKLKVPIDTEMPW